MYDFYFGTSEDISKDELRFLVSIKRMMPRWVNSMPDSEFIALANLLDQQGQISANNGKDFISAETGVGASTIAMIFFAIKYNGVAFSWDMNGEKGSLVRSICNETIGNYFKKHIDSFWRFFSFDSLSGYLGLPILKDMVNHIDLFFHDSDHTWRTINSELTSIMPLLCDGSVVALDDANQDYLHTNIGYINTMRKKMELPAINNPSDNKTRMYYLEVEELLQKNWHNVEHLPDLYKEKYSNDPYFLYFNSEFDIKASLGTERTEELDHRFDSWRVSDRNAGATL